MGPRNSNASAAALALAVCGLLVLCGVPTLPAQQPTPAPAMPTARQPATAASPAPADATVPQAAAPKPPAAQTPPPAPLPDLPGPASITGVVTDTTGALIPNALVSLAAIGSSVPLLTTRSASDGSFTLSPVAAGGYRLHIAAAGFSPWTLHNIRVQPAETVTLPVVQLGVEAIDSVVDAITVQDLAEQQVTAEEHQRILGVLPNFYVSYVANPQPLTPRQKFKLALVVSRDPLTFFTTSVSAGIEQAEGNLRGYGPGFPGYAQRYAASYGDRLSSTFLGAAVLPSLLHQDPRYFYLGHGSVIRRAFYAISTTVICKGDNGHWQPNYSNVFGNLGSAGISNLYYPGTARHSAQVTVDNSLIGVAEGAFGTLLQEFLLRHVTHGLPRRFRRR